MLKSIHIQGFKSIRDARVELGRVNVLIGANASGKSNLVGFFRLLTSFPEGHLQQYVASSGGAAGLLHHGPKLTDSIECQLMLASRDLSLEYSFALRYSESDRLFFSKEELGPGGWSSIPSKLSKGYSESRLQEEDDEQNAHAGELLGLLEEIGVYQFQDTSKSSPMRRATYAEDAYRLDGIGANLAAVLYKYQEQSPEYFRRITATVRQVMPQFGEFRLLPDPLAPDRIRLNWRERGQETLFGPHQFSDGTLRFIALATLLLQPEKALPKAIVIDEPELGLHPYAIAVLASLITGASQYCQIIVATQSVTLLDQFDVDDVIVVERDRICNATEFRRLNAEELAVWKDEYANPIALGELWERNIIGGGPH